MSDLDATPSRWHWRNWPVLVKLVAVLLVPTLVGLVVGVLRVVDQVSAAPGYTRIGQVVDLQEKLSDLIHSVERERDLATAFVAKGRSSGDHAELDQQFGVVSSRSEAVRAAAGQVDGLEAVGIAGVLGNLHGLGPLRQGALNGTGPADLVVTEYGVAIDPLIMLDGALVRQLDDVAVGADAAAAHALLASREQVSRQHAIVLAALLANHMTQPQIDDVRAAGIRLATSQEDFTAALNPAERAGLVDQAIGDAELSRQRLLQLVLNRGLQNIPLDISQDDWSLRNTVAVRDITSVEDSLQRQVGQTALTLRDNARTVAAWNAAVLIVLLALGVFIGILIARSMLRPLGVLQRTALDVAGRRLPAAMAQVRAGDVPEEAVTPVAVTTREEIGQVARAFDDVHRQAMRLAGEQARLRAHVNDIFVNLSRRSQGLVERQLQLIDRLESSEQDPEALDNLFQLDHLATRMRRNSDNLLVLAGTDATKRTSRPVRLVDVLRAAVSEVEQYQRLVLQQPPDVLVLGRTAGDLVHLLAELLDNATQFSPPDTHVMVSAESAQDGAVSIEVMDRGVGMTELEVAEANHRLASTPVVDASVSRRMGLFVVGRLAVRHGIKVQLRGGEDGIGVCASVSMPPRLVRSAAETADLRPAVPVAALPSGNGSSPEHGALMLGRFDGPGTPPGSHEYRVDTRSLPANGNGSYPVGVPHASNGSDYELPRRPANRSAPVDQPPVSPRPAGPPMPPGPHERPASAPQAIPSADAARNLFRPGGVHGGSAGSPGPGPRVTLQHSTPIFDDVASAWFRDHQAVPVRWAASDSPAQQAGPDSPAQPAATAGEQAPAAAGVPAVTDVQAQPAVVDSAADPVIASSAVQPVAAQTPNWGAADDGWRAAQALAEPAGTEVTSAGLPRRRPKALLVPGAAGGARPAAPANAPLRSAEVIRGRLTSYQQGIREGRQIRRDQHGDADGSHHKQQETAEETT